MRRIDKYIETLRSELGSLMTKDKTSENLVALNRLAKSVPIPDGYIFGSVEYDTERYDLVCVWIEHPNGSDHLHDLQRVKVVNFDKPDEHPDVNAEIDLVAPAWKAK